MIMTKKTSIHVLFVCLGNICRSPMAEAVFRHLVQEAGLGDRIKVASVGTGNWHAGEPPHRGTLAVLRQKNIAVGDKRARTLTAPDFDSFNIIIAMDAENVTDIQAAFGKRVKRLLEYAPNTNTLDVPDPYYNGRFDQVYDLVLAGSKGLLDHIRKEYQV